MSAKKIMCDTRYKQGAVTNGRQIDNRFHLVKTLEIVVPENYNHATRLDSFRVAHQNEERKEFYFYDGAITDANYGQTATTKLTPGRKFKVKIFGIKKWAIVSSPDCIAQLKRVGAILTGAQGASLVYEQRKSELPKGNWYASFDEKDALWLDSSSRRRVPHVYARSDGTFSFSLCCFEEDDWSNACCLLAFCD